MSAETIMLFVLFWALAVCVFVACYVSTSEGEA